VDTEELQFFDPATGEVTRRLAPACQHSGGSFADGLTEYDSSLLYDEATAALYVAFGSSEHCIQKWSLDGSEPQWEARLDYDLGYSAVYDNVVTLSGDTLYLTSEGGQLWAFDVTTGERRDLLNEENTELYWLGEQDGVVVLNAINTRGSRKAALWGVDATTGEVLWRNALEEAEPIPLVGDFSQTVFSDGSAWAARLTGSGILVLRAMGTPQQLTVETIGLRDGARSPQTTLPLSKVLSASSYSVTLVGWRGSRAWLLVDWALYRVNTDPAEVELIWP
jgi:hypothetical protein